MRDSACWSELFPWAAWKEGSAKTFVKVKQRIKIARQKKKMKTNQKYPDQEKNASPRQYERVTQEMFLQIRQLSKKKNPNKTTTDPSTLQLVYWSWKDCVYCGVSHSNQGEGRALCCFYSLQTPLLLQKLAWKKESKCTKLPKPSPEVSDTCALSRAGERRWRNIWLRWRHSLRVQSGWQEPSGPGK